MKYNMLFHSATCCKLYNDIEDELHYLFQIYNMNILLLTNTNEPQHEISNNVVCATSKGSDQPTHIRSLIRAFARRLNILWMLSFWPNVILSF